MNTNLETGRITSRQLMFTVVCYLSGSTMLTGFIVPLTKQDTWLVVITGFGAGLFVAWIIMSIAKSYPRKTLMDINDIVFGKVIGKILSVLYIFFFASFAILDVRALSGFIQGSILTETPLIVIAIVCVLVMAYAIHNGITTIVRLSFLAAVIIISIFIFNGILLVPKMDFNNFTPSFTLPLKNYVYGSFIVMTIPFGGSMTFLMVLPFVKEQEKMHKYFYLGGVIGFFVFIFVILRDWAVLGQTATIFTSPTFQAIRLIKIGDVLTRLEVLFSIIFILSMFYRTVILFYAATLGTAQLLKLKSYKPYVYVFGATLCCLAISAYKSTMDDAYFGPNIAPAYIFFVAVLMPSITLIITKIRSRKKKLGVTNI